MKCKIVKIEELSGRKASVYSLIIEGETDSLLEQFALQNEYQFEKAVDDIFNSINQMANETGAREHYFKLNEGTADNAICALFDVGGRYLRLYGIRLGTTLIILGGGGEKPKTVKAFQEVPKLKIANYFLRDLAIELDKKIKEREVRFTNNYFDLEGDLEFDLNE